MSNRISISLPSHYEMAGPIRVYRGSSAGFGPRCRHTEGPTMDEFTHIGLDVHKDTIAVAVLRPGASECEERVIPNTPEALRNLVRARENLQNDRRIARQRIRSFLLRYGKRYPSPGARWSFRFEVWMRALRFDEPASQAAFDHLVSAYSVRDAQLAAIDKQIEEAASVDLLAGAVARLRAFRGIDTLTAVTLLTETCDFQRFATAGSFMAFTGLAPSEHSSGTSRHQGSITKSGNAHVRRVLVEAAWAYRHRPAVRGAHAKRLEGQSPEVAAYSWAAQCRLNSTYRKLAARKGPNKAVVAVARELSGFVWGAMTERMAV